MARMFPELSEAQLDVLDSQAEANVYRALRDGTPDTLSAYYSVGWILRNQDDEARDGEADFLICHPDHGFVAVEVKGGGIGFDAVSGDWYSIDRHSKRHTIKDPVRQALRAKFSVLNKLQEHPRWATLRLGRIEFGHAVFFPDINDVRQIERPDLPSQIIGCRKYLTNIGVWVENVFQHWQSNDEDSGPMGPNGMHLFKEVFAHSFEIKPLLSATLAAEEERRIRLTQEQARVLDLLKSRRRVAVSGGAGTGKTLLAVEKAKRLANEGFRTLLTCYNTQLGDHLAEVCTDIDNLEVMHFHRLCKKYVDRASQTSGRDLLKEAKVSYPGKNVWDVQFPNALAYAAELLEDRFDAIVCDEGQDFREDYWFPLEMLLSDYEQSPLYVFFDDNQNIYHRASTFPIQNEPFTLSVNCRNTEKIHNAAYHYYRGEPIAPPEITGSEIETLTSPSLEAQTKKIQSRITELIAKERVAAQDIVVLVADSMRKSDYYETLRHLPLPKPCHWLEEGSAQAGKVVIDTVGRFKGLEATVVFFWGLDGLDLTASSEMLYVGMSRPKSLLLLVGTLDVCNAILQVAGD